MATHKYLDYAGLVELVSKLKAYTDDKVSNIDLFIVVAELPTSDILVNKIYLVPSPNAQEGNVYDEYIYANNAWELLGSVTLDTDLSNYYTKTEIDNLISQIQAGEETSLLDYYTKTETDSLLDAKQDVLTAGDNVTISGSTISATVPTKVSELENDSGYVTESELETGLATKQDTLTAGGYIIIDDNSISVDIEEISIQEIDDLF